MWKKNLSDEMPIENRSPEPVKRDGRAPCALIGPSIVISGGLAGEEDVVIQGKVEGTVEFRQHNVTIGQHGHVKADVYAREIEVEGVLVGDLHGETRVTVRRSGQVTGNITAPRVVMEDGALFKGSIDMPAREGAAASDGHRKSLSSMPAMAGRLAGGATGNADNRPTRKAN